MLTTSFIAQQFNVINSKFFGSELLTPRFEITHVKSYLGQFHWRYSYGDSIFSDFVIRISDMFNRSEEDVINTIAHEMIHLYIRQNKIRDTRPHHGRVFNSIANRLNREGGFRIARTDSVDGCGLRYKSGREWLVACFLSGGSGRYFQFVINKNYINYYLGLFERNKSHYKDAYMFKSSDDKRFAQLTECRKSVRGRYISKEQFETQREVENLIYG